MLVVRMSPSSLLQRKNNRPTSLNKMLFFLQPGAKQKEQSWNIHKGEEKRLLSSPWMKSCCCKPARDFLLSFLFPKDSIGKVRGKKNHTKAKPKRRHIHLGCSSSADLLPRCSLRMAEMEARKVPAGVGERLFPVLLHCAKRGGSRRRQRSPPAGTPRQPQVSGRCWDGLPRPLRPHLSLSTALLTHVWGQAPAPGSHFARGTAPSKPRGGEAGAPLGNWEPRPEIKQSSKALPARSSSSRSPPTGAGMSHTLQLGSIKRGQTCRDLPAPCICCLHAACSCCLGAEEGGPRDPCEMVPGCFSDWGRKQVIRAWQGQTTAGDISSTMPASLPVPQDAATKLHWQHVPQKDGFLFPHPNQRRRKIRVGKKGREKVPLWQRVPSAGGRDWSQAGVLLLQLPD